MLFCPLLNNRTFSNVPIPFIDEGILVLLLTYFGMFVLSFILQLYLCTELRFL